MTLSNRIRTLLIVAFIASGLILLEEKSSLPIVSGFIAPAEGIVGRPLTPVSVAGVARRTVRRCAVGVYRC
jgi:hypothetical protein